MDEQGFLAVKVLLTLEQTAMMHRTSGKEGQWVSRDMGAAIIYFSSDKFLSVGNMAAQSRAVEMEISSLMFLQRTTR